MKEKKIKINPNEVKDFVDNASKCDFDIDILYKHFVIDAKSILGIMAMDLQSILTVKYYGENAEFENYIKNLEVA